MDVARGNVVETNSQQLTAAQQEAVEHQDGPMLILAGPGSGKTRVVTHRIANLLQIGIPAHQIAALTFTNKAAQEMGNRLATIAPGQDVWMGTFHRFCARLLRRYASMVGLAENYSIYDTSDSKQAMKRAIAAAEVSTSHTSADQIAAVISRAKNRLVSPEMMQGQSLRHNEAVAARVYPVYQKQLLLSNAVDFDDLLFHVANLLRENPELRSELDSRYRYIMVDEYQDTNLAQYAIVRSLSVDYPNLAVTGDPDQSIYGWRGADINNILDFEKDYPHVKTVRLEKNYRSAPNILRIADQLIKHNTRRKDKQLLTDREEGAPVVLRMYEDGYREADDIADQITAAIQNEGCRPQDFAVFCRMNALTRSVEHAFRSRGLPYQIVNGVEFYQRKEIKDLLAYFHLVNNPAHDVALQRVINVPTRGIGAKSIERLRDFADGNGLTLLDAARHSDQIEALPTRSATKIRQFVEMFDRLSLKATGSLEELLLHLLEQTDYRAFLRKSSVDEQDNSPLANVDELLTAAVEFDRQFPEDGSLEAFLEQVALVSDTDAFDEENDRVTLMTMHAAKGLEFPRVFIIGVEDDLLPHYRSKEDPMQVEEERRLLFVGITRAEERLQLSCCKRRALRGDLRPVVGSPFLMELPREEMRFIEPEDSNQFFDSGDEFGDESFSVDGDAPEIWDQSNDSATTNEIDEVCQLPPDELPAKKAAKKPALIPAGLKTAANLLNEQSNDDKIPLNDFRNGMIVHHEEYGAGKVTAVSGRGPKRTATIEFSSGAARSFRLAFAKLTLGEQ